MALAPRPKLRCAVLGATMLLLLTGAGTAGRAADLSAGEEFHSSGGGGSRQCGYDRYTLDMTKILDKAREYPNARIFIVTPQEKSQLEDQIAAWNSGGGQPMQAMAPCFNCSNQYEACIVFDRGANRSPAGDEFGSNGAGSGGDQYGSNGGTNGTGSTTGDNDCIPDYANSDKPGLTPDMHYLLGFSQAARKCMTDTATIQNLGLGILAARFKQVAAVLLIAAAPGVIDAAIHPPGYSRNPDPYLQGREEGKNLCEWGLKVSPALIARCGMKPAAAIPGGKALSALEVALADLGWLEKMNPSGNMYNCGLEVMAVDEALAGRGALPAPPTSCAGTTIAQLASKYNGQFSNYGSHADINNMIFRAGDGSRGIVFAQKPSGTGHYFNIVNHGGDVMLLDGQLGKVMSWASYREMGFSQFSLLRTN